MLSNLWGLGVSNKKQANKKVKKYVELTKQGEEVFTAPKPTDEHQGLESFEKRQREIEGKFRKEVLFGIQKVKEEEKEIYSRQKRATEREIIALQEEIQVLKANTDNLDRQLDVAVERAIVEPSTYDISFLRKLRATIKKFIEDIEDASLWLAEFSQRSSKKGAFWGTFSGKNGGGQYLLSPESYLARSAG